ncbi:MAG TPA: hypothetical protein PLW32_11530 [Chitinophagaceae bacterium]|nr:hypothetical protein [Chitinophagaceae bacterium]
MSKIKLLSIAVLLLLLANIGLVTFLVLNKPPHMPPPRMGMNEQEPKRIIIEKLHFNENQIAQYEILINVHQATIKELNNSFNQVKNSLYQTLLNETTITKDSLINQLGLLQTKIERTHYNHFKEIKSICLPNQLANFNELSKELSTFFSPDKKNRNQPQD